MSRKGKIILIILVILLALFLSSLYLDNRYATAESETVLDRVGELISIRYNKKGLFAQYYPMPPEVLTEALVAKEDKFFYRHFGFNPVSIVRAIYKGVTTGKVGASSTITQQLAKVLLGNEFDRTVLNKITETWFAFALELFHSKKRIMEMYANSVYMGNQIQGFGLASKYYFGKDQKDLSQSEMLTLLATISNPSYVYPGKEQNKIEAGAIATRLGLDYFEENSEALEKPNITSDIYFDLVGLLNCKKKNIKCQTTIDKDISVRLRQALIETVEGLASAGVTHGAIVVIKVPENELLAIVGSPYPRRASDAYQINMALEARPIGSTIKPFIYTFGFERGLRPYTLADDREYKYPISTGFPLYPKNFDGEYRGQVTLYKALSNSLNVPTLKVLEYISLESFYDFLGTRLSFVPLVNIESYAYGIALGGLEMDLLTLSEYFTTFPNSGVLRPLRVINNLSGETINTPMSKIKSEKKVFDNKYVQLINRILSDREAGVEQFGSRSNLNLPVTNVALKTGTSRDFHDSWTIGYTPNFVVGVWMGRADNKELENVTGQRGAGKLWSRVMDIMINSKYYTSTKFDDDVVKNVETSEGLNIGLAGDDIGAIKNRLLDQTLVYNPHPGDKILLERDTVVPLISPESVTWFVNGKYVGEGSHILWVPKAVGDYTIEARLHDRSERVTVSLTEDTNVLP